MMRRTSLLLLYAMRRDACEVLFLFSVGGCEFFTSLRHGYRSLYVGN